MDSEGAGKVGSQEWKALRGLFLMLPVNAGDWEAFRFLLLFPCPSAGKSADKEGDDGRRVPEVACLPPLHPGSWRYGPSAAACPPWGSLWDRPLKLSQTGTCEVT